MSFPIFSAIETGLADIKTALDTLADIKTSIDQITAAQDWAEWIPISLNTGWTDTNSTLYGVARYRVSANNIQFSGYVTCANIASNRQIAVLPAIARPLNRHVFIVPITYPTANNEVYRVDIDANGSLYTFPNSTNPNSGNLSLSNIIYSLN